MNLYVPEPWESKCLLFKSQVCGILWRQPKLMYSINSGFKPTLLCCGKDRMVLVMVHNPFMFCWIQFDSTLLRGSASTLNKDILFLINDIGINAQKWMRSEN